MDIKSFLYSIFWKIIGYDNSLFDNRIVQHIAGGCMLSHIFSLFSKYYWLSSIIISIIKELFDHFIFGCGGNEIKHFIDIFSWTFGGLIYYLIKKLKGES